ncbi:MAG: phage tail tape measure protein, partial [Culicoidibacterales bacterium]
MATQTPAVEIPINADSSGALQELDKTWKGVQKVDDNVSKMNQTFQGLQNAGASLTKNVTLPLVGMGTAAVTMAMSFEESFAKVSTMFGGVNVDTDNLKSKVLELSDATGVSANELNEGLYSALSAGIPVTEDMGSAMEFLTTATELSKAGFASSEQAVDILTTAINAYGLEAEQATAVSDMFMQVQNSGKTTIGELAAVMGGVIPTAAAANVGLENLGAAMAHLTANGIPTAQAATKVNAMLGELSTTGSKTDKVLREQTGKSFAQLSEEGMDLADVLSIVEDNADQNGLTLKDMFGSVEAGTAALTITKEEGNEFKDVLDKMGDSAGNTTEAFEIMNNTPMNEMKKAMENLKNAGIELGNELIPVVLDIVDGISDMVDWFKGLDEETQDMIIKGALLVGVLGPVLTVVGKLGTAGVNLWQAFKNIGTHMGLFKTAAEGVAGSATPAATNTSALSGAMGALGGTAAGAAISVGAVVAALVVGVWKTVTDETKELEIAIENTQGAVEDFYNKLKEGDDVAATTETWVDKLAKSFGIENDSVTEASKSVNKHMENLALNSGLTESAQEVVKNFGTQFGILTEQMTLASTEQKVITDEYAATMISSYQTASDTLLTEMDSRHQAEISKINEKYTILGQEGSTAHQNELSELQTHYENSKTSVNTGMDEIERIYKEAWANNRELTADETNTINGIVQTNFVEGMITAMNLTGDEADTFRQKWATNMSIMGSDAVGMSATWTREGNTMVGTMNGVAYYVDETTGKIKELSRETIGDKKFYVSDDRTIQIAEDKIQSLINKQIPNKYFTVTQENKVVGNGGHAMYEMNANGTNDFKGGLTTINERIYDEIIDLPQGTRIYSATQSQHMMDEIVKNNSRGGRSSSNNISIAFGDVRIDSDMDIKQIAKQLA